MPGYRRPRDDQYWTRPWSETLFSGDLFDAIPFGEQPTVIIDPDQLGSVQHFQGPLIYAFGMLISPTCDMYESLSPAVEAHPYRVLVPVVDLQFTVGDAGRLEASEGLLRSRDTIYPYMYLPPLPGCFDESRFAPGSVR